MTTPSFSSFQWSLSAQTFFFFRRATTRSLSAMGVSLGLVFGRVERGSSASAPPPRYAASHRSRVRLPYGQTFTISSQDIVPSARGRTQRSRSSLIVSAIWTMARVYGLPPYVCAHYHALMTDWAIYATLYVGSSILGART